MRTTLDLDDRLIRTAKKTAAERGVSLTRLIEDSLRLALTGPAKPKAAHARWVPFKGRGLKPGVDIFDRSSLYEVMDGLKVTRS